jgi:hypothetical protein
MMGTISRQSTPNMHRHPSEASRGYELGSSTYQKVSTVGMYPWKVFFATE